MLKYDDERLCKNPNYPEAGPAPQTYPNKNSTVGIAAMPGGPGIPNPLMPIIQAYVKNKTLPAAMPKSNYFKIAMGEGGSAGGKFADMDPYNPGQKLASAINPPSPAQTGEGAKPNEAPGAAGAANSAAPTPTAAPDAAPAAPPAVASSASSGAAASPAASAPAAAAPKPATPKTPKAGGSPKGSAPKGSRQPKGSAKGTGKGSRPKTGGRLGSKAPKLSSVRSGYVDEDQI